MMLLILSLPLCLCMKCCSQVAFDVCVANVDDMKWYIVGENLYSICMSTLYLQIHWRERVQWREKKKYIYLRDIVN